MNNSNSNLLKIRKCYICDQNASESDYCKSIFQLKTKHSESLIYKLVEKFLETTIQKKCVYDENRNIICQICVLKIDEYDLAILTAQNIEYDLTQLIIQTNEKYENIIDEFLMLNKHDNTTENVENKMLLVDNNCQRNTVICNENVDDIDYVCDYINASEDDSDFEINVTEVNSQYSNNDNTGNKIVTTTSTTNENNIVKKSDDSAKAPTSVPAAITTKTNALNNLNTTNSSHISKRQLNDKCFKCSKCESFYPVKMDLIEHQKIHNRQAICDICGKTFSSEGTLNVHVNNLHRILTPFRCEVCGKDFTRRGAIDRHMRIHTGEKKYQCEKCGKKFIHQSSFRAHNLIHDNIRNVKCPICGFAFRINSHLRVHMLVHTGEKPHACPTCGRTFAKRCNMYAHYKSHQDIYRIYENLHICLICNISFRKAATLVEHVSQHYLNSSSKIEISKEIKINSTDADSFSDNSYSTTSDSNSSV